MHAILAIVILAAVFAVAYGIRIWAQRRTAGADLEMQTWAESQGYKFVLDDDARVGAWSFRPFGVGEHRHAKRVVSGKVSDHWFVAFDYSYETGGGTGANRAVWHNAFCLVQLPTELPDLAVDAETARDKLHLGSDSGLDLGDPEFAKVYQVQCADPQLAAELLPSTTRNQLLTHRLTGLHITGDQLIAWQKNSYNKPEVVAERLTLLADLIAAIPTSVWQNR